MEIDKISSFEVNSKKQFIEFINLLRQDLVENPKSWENKNLNDFLDAIDYYAEDIQGYYENFDTNINSDEPSWQVFADIFKGAKVYE